MANVDIVLFLFLQTDRGPARRGAHTPNIRSENSKENFFLACTSTKRNACNCHGCSTSPTDKWRSGFKTVAWRRKSWTETGYSITHPTLSFRSKKPHYAVATVGPTVFTDSWRCIKVWGHFIWIFLKKRKRRKRRNEHELMWTFIFRPCFLGGKVYWILSLPRERRGLNNASQCDLYKLNSPVTKTDLMYFVIKRFFWLLLCFKIRNVEELK